MSLTPEELHARARRVRLLLLDVDGVLTDGTVSIDSVGGESKRFFIRDGAAMVWAGRVGLEIGWLSGRPSEATTRRAAELGVRLVSQRGPDKHRAYEEILTTRGFAEDQLGFMGDDLLDLPVLARVGFSAAPNDAVDEVQERVHWVSRYPGGRGAVRELIELILRAQDNWNRVLESFSR